MSTRDVARRRARRAGRAGGRARSPPSHGSSAARPPSARGRGREHDRRRDGRGVAAAARPLAARPVRRPLVVSVTPLVKARRRLAGAAARSLNSASQRGAIAAHVVARAPCSRAAAAIARRRSGSSISSSSARGERRRRPRAARAGRRSPSLTMSRGPARAVEADDRQALAHRLDDHHPEALEARAEREQRRRRHRLAEPRACGPCSTTRRRGRLGDRRSSAARSGPAP